MSEDRRWRKSSRSGQNKECIELPDTLDGVRDSKNSTVLKLSKHAVHELLATAKTR